MKTPLLLRTLLIAGLLASPAARAADPQPAPAVPHLRALVAMLNQLAAEAGVEPEAAAEEAPAPAPKNPAAPAPVAPRLPAMSLKMSSLTPSAALGGRGANPQARAAGADWRVLFPLKPARN